ncbi:MAG: hypothetical protein JWO02_2398 [Solirubrobacterales bacterium]|nr:hypothetical protein [Solirubrobacterales bacterium]
MTTRDRTVVMVLGLFALVAAFWFLLLSPKRQDLASVKDRVVAAQTRLDTANASAQSAAAAKAKYAADYKAVANLGKAVPADDDVPSLVYQLQTASQDSKIAFDSIKLTGASTPAAAPVSSTTTAQAGQLAQQQNGGTTSTGTTTGTTPATPPTTTGATTTTQAAALPAVAAAQTAFAGLPPGATVGPAGLPTMPFDFEFSGPFLRLERLLKRIDAFTKTSNGQIKVNGRLMTIDSISLTGFPAMKAVIHATAFLVPDAQGLLNGATPQAPGTAVPAVGTAPGGTAPVTPVATAIPTAGVGR